MPLKFKFSHKVFLILLLNSVLVMVCLLLIARYYASRNFETYVNKMEMERLQRLSIVLGQAYQKNQSWRLVLEDLGHWLAISNLPPGPPPGVSHGGRSFHKQRPSFLPGNFLLENQEGGKPVPLGGQPAPPLNPSPPHTFSPAGPPPPHNTPPGMVLFDAEKRLLLGNGADSADVHSLQPIMVGQKVIGWLGMRSHELPTHHLDAEFLKAQSQTFYTLGGVALLLAVLITSLLSRQIMAPVKELAEATRALTSRRFDTRIEVRSRDEFGQLATDFNNMAQALERYEQMRRQWMADISHELRTPLAILRGEIEAMQDGVRPISPEAVESLHFEVLHLSRIVHELHDLSLIESQPFQADLKEVNPLEVLEDTLRSFSSRFQQQEIRIEAPDSGLKQVIIQADADRLKQLYANLLENALRYVQAPGVLKISSELQPGHLLLAFEDSGPGVPEASLPRLFDRLYRVDTARSRAQGGSGLGLAICKGIVESFGGEISASRAATGGLRIGIVFPVLSG